MSSPEQATSSTSSTSNIRLITDAFAGNDLSKNPFAAALEQPDIPDAILELLQEREKGFKEYREGSRRLTHTADLVTRDRMRNALAGLRDRLGFRTYPPAPSSTSPSAVSPPPEPEPAPIPSPVAPVDPRTQLLADMARAFQMGLEPEDGFGAHDSDQQAYSHYPEGSLQSQPSGQRRGSSSPYVVNIPFPEPHYGGSASHPQASITPSPTTPNLTVPTHHQYEHRGPPGPSQATGLSSDSQRLDPVGAGSDTGDDSAYHSPQHGDRIPSSPLPELRRGGPASHPRTSITLSQTTQGLSVAAHDQHERRGSHGDSPATRASSDSQRLDPAGAGSDTGGSSTYHLLQPGVQPHHADTTPRSYSSRPPLLNRLSHLHSRPKEPELIIKRKGKRLCDNPTLSSWLENMDKLSRLIDRLQELASATSLDFRDQLFRQVASLRTSFKRQRQRYFQFVQLTEEYANRYLLDISTEIELQSSFLDKLEKRLDMAKTLYYKADDLRKSYESGTMNFMKSLRETALKQLLPAESDLFREVEFVLGEISRCYKELDKFWKDEICRADMAFRTRRVDPDDVERWRNFKTTLQQTIESWKANKQGGDIWNILHDNRPVSSGANLGAIASSLFPALNTLKGWLQRIQESASVEHSNMSLGPILQAKYELVKNSDLCLTFFRRCVGFGEMVAPSSAALINHLAFSRIRVSNGLLEGAVALGTEAPDVSLEKDAPFQGSRKFDSVYKQAVPLQQKTAILLNSLVGIVSTWVIVADSLPDSLPDGFSLRRLRDLADAWEKERASMRMVLAALTDDPAERLRYRCLSSIPSRSCMSRLMTKLVGFV